MIQDRFDQIAADAQNRYRGLLESFTGAFHESINTSSAFTLRSQPGALSRASERFLTDMREHFSTVMREVASNGASAAFEDIGPGAKYPQLLVTFASEPVEHLMEQIEAVVRRDETTVLALLRKMALRVEMIRQSSRYTESQALIAAREHTRKALKFAFLDKAGRSWRSEGYIRTTVRLSLVTTYVESYLLTALENGYERAFVAHPDAKHKNHGLQFSIITPKNGLPSYDEIKSQVFHPNTKSLVSIK